MILIFFNDKPLISRTWLEEHWKEGKVYYENVWDNKQYGLIEYITLVKTSNFQPEELDGNKVFTKFPPNVRLITISQNLQKEKPYYDMNWTRCQYNSFINEVKKCQGQIFYDGHYYGKDKYCLDKVFIHNADDVINML